MRRFLAGTGRVLITLGLLILLFVAYQLWGTGLYTAREQHRLQHDFEHALSQQGTTTPFPSATTAPNGATPTTTTTIPAPSPPEGEAVAHLVIPKIDVDKYVVQGVDESDLRKGPGHYPLTPMPGQAGNAAIAGHRTTYGAPFGPLDDLENGDLIEITTLQGTFQYKVYDKFPVAPDAFEVLDPDPSRAATLTLTTCNPKYSAAQRLIVKAELVLPSGAGPLPSSVNPNDGNTKKAAKASGDGLSGKSGPRLPALLLGIAALLVGLLWWWFFHRHPRWTTWLVGAIPFGVVLFFFYFFLERALPANY